MAEGRDAAAKDLEKEITCALCHGHYTEPKVLPCCHYYCKQCLHQLTLRTGIDKPFSCPECRKDTTLPEGGLDNLPTAFFVNRMKEVHSKLELASHDKVDAKCEKVAGSPFPEFTPGQFVRVISGLEEPPYDVAVTITGDIIVTEDRNVEIFDKNGISKNVDFSQNSASVTYCVAVDSTDGSIFLTAVNIIIKLSPDYELVNKFTGDEESVEYGFIAVVGDEVMVSEVLNDVVMVYSKDLKYVRQFGSHGNGPGQFRRINGISSDENGNLYVGEHEGSVQVVSNGGDFLYSFRASDVQGVCVAGQYVYVAEQFQYRVSVFTIDGKCLTSFGSGHYGTDKGEFSNPMGVCVDKDGFVYVCDFGNRRIQVFKGLH